MDTFTPRFIVCAMISLILPSLAMASGPSTDPGPTFGPMDDYTTDEPIPQWQPMRSRETENITVGLFTKCAECTYNPQLSEYRADYPLTVEYGIVLTLPSSPDLPPVSQWDVTWQYGVNQVNAGGDSVRFRILLNNGIVSVTAAPGEPPVLWSTFYDSGVDLTFLYVNKHMNTYDLWGQYGVVMTALRQDNPDDNPPPPKIEYKDWAVLVANLPSPGQDDLAQLAPLVEGGGIRDMIARSSRPEFEFGFAPYEAGEITARMHSRDACPRTPGPGESDAHNWGCNYADCTEDNDYCADDPKQQDYLVLPMDIPQVQDYAAKEFNTLTMDGLVDSNNTARKARLENGYLVPNTSYDLVYERLDFAIENDMYVNIPALLYSVPRWMKPACLNGYAGVDKSYYDVAKVEEILTALLRDRLANFLNYEHDGKTARITTLQVVNEVVRSHNNETPWTSDDAPFQLSIGAPLQYIDGRPFTMETLLRCNWHYNWTWFWLSNRWTYQGDTWLALPLPETVTALENFFHAAYDEVYNVQGFSGNMRFMFNENGHENPYEYSATGDPELETFKSIAIREVVNNLRNSVPPVNVDTVGFQGHFAAWEFLEGNWSTVNLKTDGLRAARDAIRDYESLGIDVLLTELDMRISIPTETVGQDETSEWSNMKKNFQFQPVWASYTHDKRQALQGAVYEAYLNAVLCQENLKGVYLWQLADKYNWLNRHRRGTDKWPFTPVDEANYPSSTQAALFGDNPCTSEREVWWPKPAYFGVRKAFENYFGPAATVKDANGREVLRFVRNGNVVLLGEGATVRGNGAASNVPLEDEILFTIRRKADQVPLLVLHASGGSGGAIVLSLAGNVVEFDSSMQANDASFQIRDASGCESACEVDSSGNLRLQGYMVVDGLSYTQGRALY